MVNLVFHSTAAPLKQSVIAIGNFDGVHLGHQKLLSQAKQVADQRQLPLVLVVFEPMPREFFAKNQPQPGLIRLQRLSEKWQCLQNSSVDTLYVIRFNQSIASLTPEQFVDQILIQQLGAQHVVVGDDFRFGKQRLGDVAALTALGEQRQFSVAQVDTVLKDGGRVSSSRIRQLLQTGDITAANRLLDRPYALIGRVVYGDQRGREWGFPTINIPLFRQQSPLTGIFAVRVEWGNLSVNGVASIGYRPVFKLTRPLLEVFLLDFDQEIYGQRVKVSFLKKLRDEANFNSVEALISQIQDDVAAAKLYFQ